MHGSPFALGLSPRGNLHGSPERSNFFGSHGQRPWFDEAITIPIDGTAVAGTEPKK